MMKNRILSGTTAIVALALLASFSFGWGQGTSVTNDGSTAVNLVALKSRLQNQSKGTLSNLERDGLVYMREEEKMAFDAYNVFSAKWGPRPFGNISRAEQSHMDSVKVLLDRYGIPDPMASSKPGEFKDPALQKLYNGFVKAGLASRVGALKVGATIEDLDIYDLDKWMKSTKNEDIKLVYGYLTKGSRNHMRAFVFNLGRSGETYKPQYISQDAFQKIVDSPTERGGG